MRGATSRRSAARSTPSPCPRSSSRPNSSRRFRSGTSTGATAATTKRPPTPRGSEPLLAGLILLAGLARRTGELLVAADVAVDQQGDVALGGNVELHASGGHL